MATNTNQFLFSVADAFLVDKDSDAVVMKSHSLLNSSLKTAVTSTPIRGGFGGKLLFNFKSDKDLTVDLEDARWDETFLALSNNSPIQTVADDYYKLDEIVTLVGGVGTTANVPTTNVYVQKPDNTILTITPSGSTFTVAGLTTETVKVTYRYSTTVDKIVVTADTFPKAYRLILKGKLFQTASGQQQTGEVEIIIENYLLDGKYDITLSQKGASSSKVSGSALIATNAAGQDYYAEVRIKNLAGSSVQLMQIAASPSTVSLSTISPTQQISVIGIQSGLKSNVIIPSADCTFSSATTADVTVSSSGLLTRVATGSSLITIVHVASGLKDYVNVTCV